MYKNILVGLSLEQGLSNQLLTLADALLDASGKITLIHVIDLIPSYARLYMNESSEQNVEETALKHMKARLTDFERLNVESVIQRGHAGQTILDYAREKQIDCIIVGSHKPGLQDFFLGSTSTRISRYAECSVHIVR